MARSAPFLLNNLPAEPTQICGFIACGTDALGADGVKIISARPAALLLSLVLTLLATSPTAAADITLHTGPGRNYAALKSISSAQRIDVRYCVDHWCAVSVGPVAGWLYEPDLLFLSNALHDNEKREQPTLRQPAPHPLERPTAPEPRLLDPQPPHL